MALASARMRTSRGPGSSIGSERSSTLRAAGNHTLVAVATLDVRSDTLECPVNDQVRTALPGLEAGENQGVTKARSTDIADGIHSGTKDLRRDADDQPTNDSPAEGRRDERMAALDQHRTHSEPWQFAEQRHEIDPAILVGLYLHDLDLAFHQHCGLRAIGSHRGGHDRSRRAVADHAGRQRQAQRAVDDDSCGRPTRHQTHGPTWVVGGHGADADHYAVVLRAKLVSELQRLFAADPVRGAVPRRDASIECLRVMDRDGRLAVAERAGHCTTMRASVVPATPAPHAAAERRREQSGRADTAGTGPAIRRR